MCAMPEKKSDVVVHDFIHHFEELSNDLLNIEQILKGREQSNTSFETLSRELESLKEDALERILNLQNHYKRHSHLFPKNTSEFCNQSIKLINELHPEQLSQRKWSFNHNWLDKFGQQLS